MTDDKLNNISRAFAMALITIICLLVFLAKAFGQDTGRNTGNHDHETNKLERWRNVRVIPAKVIYVERNEQGTRIEYVARDANEIENGWFQATKETKGDTPKKGEWYFFAFCYADPPLGWGYWKSSQPPCLFLIE